MWRLNQRVLIKSDKNENVGLRLYYAFTVFCYLLRREVGGNLLSLICEVNEYFKHEYFKQQNILIY